MSRYLGPRLKIIRKLGLLPGLTNKNIKNRQKTPGQHGTLILNNNISVSKDYTERLLEKQKLRFNYGITEKQLISYFNKAKIKRKITGEILLQLIESRLDCIVFRLGFSSTIPEARQLINHGHILVNNKKVDIPSFICKPNDIISYNIKQSLKNIITSNFKFEENKKKLILDRMKIIKLSHLIPPHLSLNKENFTGQVLNLVKRKDILIPVKELKIVEYYSG